VGVLLGEHLLHPALVVGRGPNPSDPSRYYYDVYEVGGLLRPGPNVVAATGMSLCHGWSAGPTYSLPAHVLGVQPLDPGFAKVLVEPRPADLAWATGEVPTPQGLVGVTWTRNAEEFRISLRLPATCPARVSLPWAGPHARVIADGVATATARE